MNVIVFASRKGGSGKSTLAAHLAAQVHKSTKPCLLIDADPQGALTLWHKLRGTNEPPIKTAVNSVSGIIAAAKRDGIEWVFIDTPPNVSAVVDDAIKNATMVIIPARPGVFDVNAVPQPRSAGYGLRSNARSRRSVAPRRHPAPCTSRRRNNAAASGLTKERAGSARFSVASKLERLSSQ